MYSIIEVSQIGEGVINIYYSDDGNNYYRIDTGAYAFDLANQVASLDEEKTAGYNGEFVSKRIDIDFYDEVENVYNFGFFLNKNFSNMKYLKDLKNKLDEYSNIDYSYKER